MVIIGAFVAIDILTWARAGKPDLGRIVGGIGVFLLMVFFISGQRQIRLFCFFGGMTCLLFRIAGDLCHLFPPGT